MGYSDKQIADTVRVLAQPMRPQIQESEFVQRYLPMFLANPATTDGIIFVNEWINVANSPFAEVEVYSGNDLVFIVPPLLHAPTHLTERLGDGNAYHHITQAALKYNVMPKLGDVHLSNWLNATLPETEIAVDCIQKWNIIFARYNRPLLPLPGNPTGVATPAATGRADLGDVTYEDF